MQPEPTLSEDRLRHFFDASLAIASDLSLPVVLQRTITAACELTGARYGALGIIEDDGLIREFVLDHAVRGLIPKYGVPDRVVFVRELDKTSVGKLDKKALRERYCG